MTLTKWEPTLLQAAGSQRERERKKHTRVLVPTPENQFLSRVNERLERGQEFYTNGKFRHVRSSSRNGEKEWPSNIKDLKPEGGSEFILRENTVGMPLTKRLPGGNNDNPVVTLYCVKSVWLHASQPDGKDAESEWCLRYSKREADGGLGCCEPVSAGTMVMSGFTNGSKTYYITSSPVYPCPALESWSWWMKA